MRLRINNFKKYKLSNLYVSAWKTQLFQKNYPKFLNTSVDTPISAATTPYYLQPAVNRQPGYRREDREVVVRKFDLKSLKTFIETF